jgi:hypothetical protein
LGEASGGLGEARLARLAVGQKVDNIFDFSSPFRRQAPKLL